MFKTDYKPPDFAFAFTLYSFTFYCQQLYEADRVHLSDDSGYRRPPGLYGERMTMELGAALRNIKRGPDQIRASTELSAHNLWEAVHGAFWGVPACRDVLYWIIGMYGAHFEKYGTMSFCDI